MKIINAGRLIDSPYDTAVCCGLCGTAYQPTEERDYTLDKGTCTRYRLLQGRAEQSRSYAYQTYVTVMITHCPNCRMKNTTDLENDDF